jgi:hypothetical protein
LRVTPTRCGEGDIVITRIQKETQMSLVIALVSLGWLIHAGYVVVLHPGSLKPGVWRLRWRLRPSTRAFAVDVVGESVVLDTLILALYGVWVHAL